MFIKNKFIKTWKSTEGQQQNQYTLNGPAVLTLQFILELNIGNDVYKKNITLLRYSRFKIY